MSIKQMQEEWPSVSWLELLNGVINLPGKALCENDTVIVAVPEYISSLLNVLAATSKRYVLVRHTMSKFLVSHFLLTT